MKKYLLSVCVLSLLGTTNAIANNVAFVGSGTIDTDLSGTVLSFSKDSDFTLLDSNINSASRLEINSGSSLSLGKNSSVMIWEQFVYPAIGEQVLLFLKSDLDT